MKRKIIKFILLPIFILLLIVVCYFFVGSSKPSEDITWGMNFSQKQAEGLGLDWKETYTALIKDMNAKQLKIATYWDLIETEKGKYNFSDVDWQIKEAEKNNIELIVVLGMKSPRWPECHIPSWAKDLSKEEQRQVILDYLEAMVLRYENSKAIWSWQVENEPFFMFGECLGIDKDFLKEEVAIVKSLDSTRPIIISDTGEWSLWFNPAEIGDIVGTTMYKRVWFTIPGFIKNNLKGEFFENLGTYINYHYPPVFYARKAELVKTIFGKETMCVELQAEPWGPDLLYYLTVEEQKKSMNLEQFNKNIDFAKRTGLKSMYLWGGEWMYWMKTKQDDSSIWDEAKKLFPTEFNQ